MEPLSLEPEGKRRVLKKWVSRTDYNFNPTTPTGEAEAEVAPITAAIEETEAEVAPIAAAPVVETAAAADAAPVVETAAAADADGMGESELVYEGAVHAAREAVENYEMRIEDRVSRNL